MQPRSAIYDDIYWSRGSTEKEAVFFTGNNIAERLAAKPATFTLAELGFGTGLNAALACRYAEAAPQTSITFISYELHPLPLPELTTIHASLPTKLQPYLAIIRTLWPTPQPGWNTYPLTTNITLQLYLGDALTGLPSQPAPADAWLLDGFSPEKNPAMWSPEILHRVGRHSRPGTTVATYTVARAVREGLAANGFTIAKQPGLPPKREILTGTFTG